ncbi:extensin family protein [Hoeflea alexandrii]|uniref:extensin-like domain-containing protein n=1 Tax=Hoeflea alexandrii TaxID=288436 RepID=UPI0035CF1B3C
MRRVFLLPLIVTLSMGVKLPETGPVPVESPRGETAKGKAVAVPAVPAPAVPVPEAKPDGDTSTAKPPLGAFEENSDQSGQAGSAGQEAEESENADKLPVISAPPVDEAALASCEAELRKLGAVFDRQDPIRGENGCGIEAPYSIEQIVPGVSLSPASQLRCPTALAMARWMDAVVVPAAEALPDAVTLARLNHGSTYVCRRRNNSATGKMSEHAIGNAIDIMSFEFKGRDPIPVSPRAGDGTVEEAFQRAVRGGACLHFTTVLGPGTNASHADHLHLDIIERKRGYRLCQ